MIEATSEQTRGAIIAFRADLFASTPDEAIKMYRREVGALGSIANKKEVRKKQFALTRACHLPIREAEFVVDGIIERNAVVSLFGDPGIGKSFLSLDIAASVATGSAFHGRAVNAGPVIYIAGEGGNGLKKRLMAWESHKKQSLEGCPLFISDRAAALTDRQRMSPVLAEIDLIYQVEGAPVLIVIDTVARSFGSGDENSTQDMSKFVTAIDEVRTRYNCAVLLVHHTGHSDKKRARGNMALHAALDADFRLERRGAVISLICTKMKDAAEPKPINFTLTRVTVTTEICSIESAALVEIGSEVAVGEKPLSAGSSLAKSTYHEAACTKGMLDPDGKFVGLHLDDWRELFYSKHTGDNVDSKKKAFQRARDDLVRRKILKVTSDVYMLAGDFCAFDISRIEKKLHEVRDTGQAGT